MNWKLIESVPKDGTEVLLWLEGCGVLLGRYGTAKEFMTSAEIQMDDGIVKGEEDTPMWFYADFRVGCSSLELSETPSHWMPLPEEPFGECNGLI